VASGPSLAQLNAEAGRLAEGAYAANTRRAYQGDWDAFVRWCGGHELPSLPSNVDTLCEYLAYLGLMKLKVSTIRRKRLAIGLAHAHAGFPRIDRDIRVRTIELGLARKYGSREVGADPLLAEDVLKLVKTLDDSPRGDRDRAIFTLAFAGAFRSSEIVALEREHITFCRCVLRNANV
jgi:site-specific recombinase XerD